MVEDDIKRMCEFIIGHQKKGNYVPGHQPMSGVFASCSLACDIPDMGMQPCLSRVAYKLLEKIKNGEVSICESSKSPDLSAE